MSWTVVTFGKHEGKTLPQVIFSDPDWFFWAMEKDALKGNGALETEARELNYKARNIRFPHEGMVAEYWIHRPIGKFDHMKLVSEGQFPHSGSSETLRKEVIDLSIPREIAPYDKCGGRNMLVSVKIHLFGSRHIRFNKSFCEKFFDDLDNFVMDDQMRRWLDKIV